MSPRSSVAGSDPPWFAAGEGGVVGTGSVPQPAPGRSWAVCWPGDALIPHQQLAGRWMMMKQQTGL